MYNNYYPAQTPTSPQSTYRTLGLKGRPVASIEEARASSIDFDGSIFFFPDLANKKIYTKQINMDGTMSLNMYELKEIPIVENKEANFITREEFEKVMISLREELAAGRQTQPQASSQPAQAPARTFQTNF